MSHSNAVLNTIMKRYLINLLALGAFLSFIGSAAASSTITVNVRGTDYTIGYVNTTSSAGLSFLDDQPWYQANNPDVSFINDVVTAIDAADPGQTWASGGISVNPTFFPAGVYFLYGVSSNPMSNVAWGAGATPGNYPGGRVTVGAPQILNGGITASYAVVVSAVPEPSRVLLASLGLGGLLVRRRRAVKA